jgi:hypothetical protein
LISDIYLTGGSLVIPSGGGSIALKSVDDNNPCSLYGTADMTTITVNGILELMELLSLMIVVIGVEV